MRRITTSVSGIREGDEVYILLHYTPSNIRMSLSAPLSKAASVSWCYGLSRALIEGINLGCINNFARVIIKLATLITLIALQGQTYFFVKV
jgi:hypothetical protein